jgi:hypothetical protein
MKEADNFPLAAPNPKFRHEPNGTSLRLKGAVGAVPDWRMFIIAPWAAAMVQPIRSLDAE